MSISVFNCLCPARFDSTGKALEKFDFDWIIQTAYWGTTIMQFEVNVIKVIWNNEKWKFIFHTVDAQGPAVLGLRTLRQVGIFIKHPMICMENVDHYSTQADSPINWKRKRMVKPRCSTEKLLPKSLMSAEECQVKAQAHNFDVNAKSTILSMYREEDEYDVEGWLNWTHLQNSQLHMMLGFLQTLRSIQIMYYQRLISTMSTHTQQRKAVQDVSWMYQWYW